MEETPRPPMIMPHLVGRASQLATLQLLVEQAKRGEGHLVLISGEAGIGKSRLVTELKTSTTSQGFLLLQGNCFPTDVTYPYAPLLDLLRSLFASHPEASGQPQGSSPHTAPPLPLHVRAGLAPALERLARDLFPLLPELVSDQAMPLLPLEPEQEKRRLFAVLATFFTSLSASSPLLIIIEDVHWSDSTSLDFLHQLARRTGSHPLLLLVTYRQEEIRAELSNWLAQLTRGRLAETLRLAPLARTDVDLMLSALFDQRHTAFDMRRFLHGELLEALYTLTEGNPFFVEETLSALIAAGDIFYAQGYWNRRQLAAVRIPQSVQDAVHQRTRQLGEAARRVLTLSAVAGRHFDFALLQQLTGSDEEQLLLIMKELVSAQLVVEKSSEQFAFRHALTQQAIYTQLLARERYLMHRTIAWTIEQLAPATPDARLEELATHFYQARDWQKAADYAQRAGEKALRLYSHRAAVDYFTWALEATHQLAHPPSPTLYRARGQAYETLGEFEQAQHDYTHALEAARATLDREAEWQSAIDLGFLWAGRDYTQAESWFRQALFFSQQLQRPALHARSLNRVGNWHLNVEQPHEALRYHQDALAIFQRLHDSPGIAETLDLLGMASYLGGDLLGGTAYYRQAAALFGELGDREGLTSSLATLAIRAATFHTDALTSAASLAEALPDAERAVRVAREIGRRSAESYALLQLGLCLGSQGVYTSALAACQQSLQIAEEIEHRQWQTAAHAMLGGVYNGMFAYQQASEHFAQALALAKASHSLFWTRMATSYLASVSLQLGDVARAEELLCAAPGPETPVQTMAQRTLCCASAELALAQGDPNQALQIMDRMTIAAEVTQGQSSLRVLKLRGEALAALPRPAEAETALKAARQIASEQGARPMHWRICLTLGRFYQTQGRKTEAEDEFTTTRTLIEALAASIIDEALHDHFLHRAFSMLPHIHPPSAKQAAKQTYGGLTAREREIAALIAQEKFNREIAEILVLSERTVETHVSNVLLKLGFTSRKQIATWAIQKGLTTTM